MFCAWVFPAPASRTVRGGRKVSASCSVNRARADLSGQEGHGWAVDPGVVGGRRHPLQVVLALRRVDVCTRQLPVVHVYLVTLHRLLHDNQRIWSGQVDEILDVLHPVNCEGATSGRNKSVLLSQAKLWFINYDTFHCWGPEKFREMKLNESGRQKVGSPVSRHSMQSYILTYCRLRKKESLIWAPTTGFFNFCVCCTPQ